MSRFEGVVVSDHWLHSQFTQVQLRSLKSKVINLNVLLLIDVDLLLVTLLLSFELVIDD